MMKIFGIALLSLALVCGFAGSSYSQCANCGADYNRVDRERANAYSQGYNQGKSQGYDQGRRDGVNQEKLVNSVNKIIDNTGSVGSAATKK
jgi:flagellar biosynthesis/type III secretory pathway protein FliH